MRGRENKIKKGRARERERERERERGREREYGDSRENKINKVRD